MRPQPDMATVLAPEYIYLGDGDARRARARTLGLLKQLTRRHLVDRYRASYLGFLWSFFNPILMMAIYSFVFRFIFRARVPDVPYMAHFITAYLAWNFFAVAVSNAASSVIEGSYLLNKASFPRALLPVSAVLSNLVNYLVTVPLVLAFVLLLGVRPGWSFLLLPVAMALLVLLAAGMGLLMASLAPFFRDLLHLLDITLMAWFFATPIVYPLSYVSERLAEKGWSDWYVHLYELNPMVGAVRFIQATMFDRPLPWIGIAIAFAWAFVLLGGGVAAFRRCAPHFSEV